MMFYTIRGMNILDGHLEEASQTYVKYSFNMPHGGN